VETVLVLADYSSDFQRATAYRLSIYILSTLYATVHPSVCHTDGSVYNGWT